MSTFPSAQRSTHFSRGILGLVLAATLVAAGALVPAAPAEAASSDRVTISKIKTKTAPYKGKTTITPNVSKSGKVEISKKTLTVKKGSKTVAKDKASVKLAAGTYKVTQKVTYRTYTVKTVTKTEQKTIVGVEGYTDVDVTCTASQVTPEFLGDDTTPFSVLVDATCTSPLFDGAHAIRADLWNLAGDGSLWYGFSEDNLDELTTFTTPEVGVPFEAILNPEFDLMKTVTTTKNVATKVYSKLKTATASQTLVIKQGKKPAWVWGTGSYNCPKGYPIKGNADSGIYHVPGGAYYSRTIPEQCFATESGAKAAGYRKSKR